MCAGLEVVVDGIIYQRQSHGGISRLFSEILPRMCDLDDSLQITLLAPEWPKQPLPSHPHIRQLRPFPIERLLRPGRIWKAVLPWAREIAQRLRVGNEPGRIWHSTYYTMLRGWNGPFVLTVVDMTYERFAHLFTGARNDEFRERKRHCVSAARAVICISKSTKDDLQLFHGLEDARIHVIPLAHSRVFGLQSDGHGEAFDRRPFILYVGDRAHYKNFVTLARAYSSWGLRDEAELVVVGRPWTLQESRCLQNLGIASKVRLLTDVDDRRLCDLYNGASAFIHPSLYEGFGIPLLEAMACGCPVVASRIPSTIEVAGPCPIYFDPRDMESLVHAMDVAISEGKESQRVAMGLEWVRRYSWERTARQTLDVYRSLQ